MWRHHSQTTGGPLTMATEKSPLDRGIYPRHTTAGKTTYYVRLRIRGKMVTVGSGFLSKTDARAYRDDKKGEIRKGLYNTVGPSRKTTVAGLMALVVADYRRNNQELEDALRHEKFWNEEAGKTLAHSITGNT